MKPLGIITALLLFAAAVLWLLREFRSAPLYPDDYDDEGRES